MIWHRLENVVPRHVYEATFGYWLENRGVTSDNEVLVQQPLMLFKVNERVFSSPPHFQCLIDMLAFYLEANRAWYYSQLHRSHNSNIQNP